MESKKTQFCGKHKFFHSAIIVRLMLGLCGNIFLSTFSHLMGAYISIIWSVAVKNLEEHIQELEKMYLSKRIRELSSFTGRGAVCL